MLLMKRSAILLAGLILISSGCNIQSESGHLSTLTISPPLNPYQSTTETPDQPTPTNPLSTAQPLIPTPTPYKHTIQAGETLYGIAIRYNISLDKLASANPGLDTRLLIVGTEVIIPLSEEENLPPTPTPYPIFVEEPTCYQTTDGELWCYVLIENNQDISLEYITLAFNIYDTDQELTKSQIAYTPLDILHPGQRLPAGALIIDPPIDMNQISITLLTAYASDRTEPYVFLSDYSLEYSQENTIAQIKGFYEIIDEDVMGDKVWIVAVGLSEGRPVALRKWISAEDLDKGNPYSFDITLYSLGPQIDQVQVFSELH